MRRIALNNEIMQNMSKVILSNKLMQNLRKIAPNNKLMLKMEMHRVTKSRQLRKMQPKIIDVV